MVQEFKVLDRRSSAVRRREAVELPDALEQLASRFPSTVRREVRRLMRTSARVAEMATVFPGIVCALAARRGPSAARLNALSLIENGAHVNTVNKAGVTPWLAASGFGDRLGGVLFNKAGADILLEHGADPKLGHPCQAQNRCRPE